MDIRIDSEFESIIQHLSDSEYAQLEANLLEDGCQEALVVWEEESILLDGHNRLRICQAHKLPYHTRLLSLPDRYSAQVWIINNQLGRRNLTPMAISDLHGMRYRIERQREGSGAPEGNQNAEKQKPQNETFVLEQEHESANVQPHSNGDTAERLAHEYGVTRATIHRDADFSEAIDTLSKEVSPTMRQTMTAPQPKEKKPRSQSSDEPKPFRPTKQNIVETARTVKEQQITLLPFMKRQRWSDFQALEAMSLLGAIPKGEHASIDTLLDEEGIPVDIALKILRNLKILPDERRHTIYTLHASADPREVSLAKSMASALPPSPDPQVLKAMALLRTFTEGHTGLGKWIKDWPLEPWIHRLIACQTKAAEVINELEAIKTHAKELHQERAERYGQTAITL